MSTFFKGPQGLKTGRSHPEKEGREGRTGSAERRSRCAAKNEGLATTWWGKGGGGAWTPVGRLQLAGSEVVNRCPSQTSVSLLWSERSFQDLPSSSPNSWTRVRESGKKLNYKTISNMEMLSGGLPGGTPVKEAPWLALRDSLCIIHLFNSVHRWCHVKAVIVICLGSHILPGDEAAARKGRDPLRKFSAAVSSAVG